VLSGGFVPRRDGYCGQMSPTGARQDDSPTGPLNPRGKTGPDAPAPPGSPLRSDAPQGTSSPGGPEDPDTGPEPEVHPSSTPDGPQTIPASEPEPEPTADGEIHARTQAEQVNEELQEENAETALDQPSDGSGGE
jgi:hypothetical protein